MKRRYQAERIQKITDRINKPTGFYMPDGTHVLGDPNMSNQTYQALGQMIKLAKNLKPPHAKADE